MRERCDNCYITRDKVLKFNNTRRLYLSVWRVKCNYKKFAHADSIDDVLIENKLVKHMYSEVNVLMSRFYS